MKLYNSKEYGKKVNEKMEQLKTLKDIEIRLDELFDLTIQGKIHQHIHKDRLKIRQEVAIKWIKELKEAFLEIHGTEQTVKIGGIWFTSSGLSGAIAILTYIFHISEDELK